MGGFFNKVNKCKRKNIGSTLVVVIITVAFVGILGTIATTAAYLNFKMKLVDRATKKTFYTAEEAVDRVYAALGMVGSDSLQSAYNNVLGNMVAANGVGVTLIDNKYANQALKVDYLSLVTEKLIGVRWCTYDKIYDERNFGSLATTAYKEDVFKNALIHNLDSFIKVDGETSLASIKNVDNIQIEVDSTGDFKLKFVCVVNYVSDREGFYSNVSFDVEIGFPDAEVNFLASRQKVPAEIFNYVLVGDSGVTFNNSGIYTSNRGIYGGGGNNIGVTIAGSGENDGLSVDGAPLMSNGDIKVNSGTLRTYNESRLWCMNLKTGNGSAIPTIKIGLSPSNAKDDDSSLYVCDDMEIDGLGSDVTINGNYYGYGDSIIDANPSAERCSAIILNGSNSKLDMSGVNKMLVAGRAFISYGITGTTNYMLGQSLALKGDQEAYLVPSSLMTNGSGEVVYNPVNYKKYMDCFDTSGSNNVTFLKNKNIFIDINEDNFFGYKYLNHENPYYVVYDANTASCYFYLNFSTNGSVTENMRKYYEDAMSGDKAGETDKIKISRKYVKGVIDGNVLTLNQIVKLNGSIGSNIVITNGSMVESSITYNVSAGVSTLGQYGEKLYTGGITNYTTDMTIDGYLSATKQFKNKYGIICKSLMECKNDSVIELKDNIALTSDFVDGGTIPYSSFKDYTSPFDCYINKDMFNEKEVNGVTSNGVFYCAKRVAGEYVVPSTVTTGIIIIDGNVRLSNSNFYGLIICSGSITVNGTGGNLGQAAGGANVQSMISAAPKDFKDFLRMYAPSSGTTGKKITDIDITDLVDFSDWTKSDVLAN